MNDLDYKVLIELLVSGTLDNVDFLVLSEEADRRLRAAGAPWELVSAGAGVFGEYRARLVEYPRDRHHDQRIADAAEHLADTLRKSGKSGYFQTLDSEVWLRAAGESFEQKVLAQGLTWPPDMPITGCTLEPFLRALAEILREQVTNFGPVDEAVPMGRESKNLKRFAIRRLDHQVRLMAQGLSSEERLQIPSDWRPTDTGPDDPWAGYGNNALVARLASVLLCSPVNKNDVSKARSTC